MAADIDRGFLRIAEGQVHYRSHGDIKAGGRPLVLIHASPASSIRLVPLIQALAGTQPLYAPDTLGNGDSCKMTMAQPEMADYADALRRQIEVLGHKEVDVYGTHTGGGIAMELAINNPKLVRKVIIDGIGLYSEETKKDMLANYTPEVKPDAFGSQFNWAWHFVRDQDFFFPWYKRDAEHQRVQGLQSPEELHNAVMEVLKSITTYHLGYRASFRYPKAARLPLLTQETMMIYTAADPLAVYKDEALGLVKRLVPGEVPKKATESDKAKVIRDFLAKP
jgi:pimeloyl-ACP methyl ester carboxylesterase